MKGGDIAVTGIGCVTPLGTGRAAFAEGIRAGRAGVGPTRSVSVPPGAPGYSAECRDFDPAPVLARHGIKAAEVSRVVPLSLAAAEEALAEAGLLEATEAERGETAVILGSGGCALDFAEREYEVHFTGKGRPTVFAISNSTPGSLASEISIAFGLRGPSLVVTTGCTSSSDAIGLARDWLRLGRARRVLVGGADAPITTGILAGFRLMRVLSTAWEEEPARASRPFDARRDGFVLGEGAWFFVLEREAEARARGARPCARILGYAATCDAFHRVKIPENPAESVRAIRLALADAGRPREAVDYVSLHGTSTKMNDRLETLAVREAFGPHVERLAASAPKSMIGHPQGASGAANLAATILSMRAGFLPPTINLETSDPECDLDYIPGSARTAEVATALVNCIGFGSKNAALVVERA